MLNGRLAVVRTLPPADHQLGVFTGAQAYALGWNREALAHEVRRQRLSRIAPGVFALPVPQGPAGDARRLAQPAVAAALRNPETYVSHLAAAALRNLPTWAAEPRPCVTVRRRKVSALAGVHVHRSMHRDGHYVLLNDVPTTSLARTVCDLVKEFGVESALVVADAALHRGILELAALRRTSSDLWGGGGDARLPQLLANLDGSAESPLESRSRWRMHLAGLPPPRPQVAIFDRAGRFIGRVDFFWDTGVVGEVDGNAKYTDRQVLRQEKWRQELLEGTGLKVVRWGPREVDCFAPTADRLQAGLARMAASTVAREWRTQPVGGNWSV